MELETWIKEITDNYNMGFITKSQFYYQLFDGKYYFSKNLKYLVFKEFWFIICLLQNKL